jgi:hypothetical protein
LAKVSVRPETKSDYPGKGQQQFNKPTKINCEMEKAGNEVKRALLGSASEE